MCTPCLGVIFFFVSGSMQCSLPDAPLIAVAGLLQEEAQRAMPKKPSVRIDKFFDDEPRLWQNLKATRHYRHLSACATGYGPLPFEDWIRVMLHIPSALTISELVRIFDEEDTMTLLATVWKITAV
jgi:hypothetical protein